MTLRRMGNILGITSVLMVGLGILAVSQALSLTTWDLPYANAFPAGLALAEDGTIFVAANGGTEVYRLDPMNDVYRSWGVGDRPDGVAMADGIPFCTARDGNLLVFFNPNGLGVTSAVLPFGNVGPGEIHRGADTDDGQMVFWIVERSVSGILRFIYDPAVDAPQAVGDPSEQGATATTTSMEPTTVTAEYEQFLYDVSLMPDPILLDTPTTSQAFTEWRLDLGRFRVEDLAVADDGTLWVSFGAPLILKIDPAAGTLQEMETIQNVTIFQGLLPDPDGSIWFGNFTEGSIGHFDPAYGLSEVWRIPGTYQIFDLAFDTAGGIWYTDRVAATVGRFDPETSQAVVYQLPIGTEPLYLEIDDAGAVWFTAGSGNFIGRLSLWD